MSLGTTTQALRSICTPAHHIQANKTKPVALVALGHGQHGKTALLEFPDGWQRTIDLVTPFDGWHPLFAELSQYERQFLRDHATPEFVNHPDGTQSRPDPLSFVRRVQSACGRLVCRNYFDVPAQNYAEGITTGYRCAAELLEALTLGHGPDIPLHGVLESASQATRESLQENSRHTAACAFLEIVEQALSFFAKQSMHRSWLAEKIDRSEQNAQDAAERRAMRARFVQRMKTAKAAKRKEREAIGERTAI